MRKNSPVKIPCWQGIQVETGAISTASPAKRRERPVGGVSGLSAQGCEAEVSRPLSPGRREECALHFFASPCLGAPSTVISLMPSSKPTCLFNRPEDDQRHYLPFASAE